MCGDQLFNVRKFFVAIGHWKENTLVNSTDGLRQVVSIVLRGDQSLIGPGILWLLFLFLLLSGSLFLFFDDLVFGRVQARLSDTLPDQAIPFPSHSNNRLNQN
jgi:hypothetical protein